MFPVKKILDKLNGLHYRQEYLCFAKESLNQSLHVYLERDKRIFKDITNKHVFAGYHPLLFAFSSLPGQPSLPSIRLILSQAVLKENEVLLKKDALATLDMKLIKQQDSINGSILYYEGSHGSHQFTSRFHQYIHTVNNRLFNRKAGNVFLHDNLYRQVQIAYAVPRIISLITIGHNGLFNLFPTDLHGQVNETQYIISLRSAGKACEQVLAAGQVLISQVQSDFYKTVYGLGKNHMQELRSIENFPFANTISEKLKWPLPQQTISFKELVLKDSFIAGIHRVLIFTIVSHQQVQAAKATLAHLHNCYASWRFNHNLPGNYLLR